MAEYIAMALKDASRESAVVLYSPMMDRHVSEMARRADRLYCFSEVERPPPRRLLADKGDRDQGQRTLEAF